MANKSIHQVVVVIIIALSLYVMFKFNLLDYFYYPFVMFFSVMIPDFLEPAKNYKHRAFFHSQYFLKIISVVLLISLLFVYFNKGWLWLSFGIIGYQSHLLIDACTPMGLPRK